MSLRRLSSLGWISLKGLLLNLFRINSISQYKTVRGVVVTLCSNMLLFRRCGVYCRRGVSGHWWVFHLRIELVRELGIRLRTCSLLSQKLRRKENQAYLLFKLVCVGWAHSAGYFWSVFLNCTQVLIRKFWEIIRFLPGFNSSACSLAVCFISHCFFQKNWMCKLRLANHISWD